MRAAEMHDMAAAFCPIAHTAGRAPSSYHLVFNTFKMPLVRMAPNPD